jgi:hypothetical protein
MSHIAAGRIWVERERTLDGQFRTQPHPTPLGHPVLIVEAGQSAGGVVAVVIAIFAAAVIFVLLASWIIYRRERRHVTGRSDTKP